QLRLHSDKGENGKGKFGQSALTVAIDGGDIYDHDHADATVELADPGGELEVVGHRYFFHDLRSRRVTLNVVKSASPQITLRVDFETGGGTEIVFEGDAPNIDLTGFRLEINFGLGLGLPDARFDLDLVPWVDQLSTWDFGGINDSDAERAVKRTLFNETLKRFISADVSVDVAALPDGKVAEEFETTVN